MFYAILASSAVLLMLITFITYHIARVALYASKEIWPATTAFGLTLVYIVIANWNTAITSAKLFYVATPAAMLFASSLAFFIHPGKIITLLKSFIAEFKRLPIWLEFVAISAVVYHFKTPISDAGTWHYIALAIAVAPVGYLVRSGRYRRRSC